MKNYLLIIPLVLLSNIAYPNEVSDVQWSLAEHFTEAFLSICATGIVGWFAKVQWDKRKLKMQHDSILYKELIELLPPSKGVVALLRDHNFAQQFQKKVLSPLEDFEHLWRTVDKKFMDKSVESARENLFKINCEFLHELSLASGCVSYDNGDIWLGIHDPNQTITNEHKKQRDQQVTDVNNLADRWVEAYDRLIRIAKGKLLASE